MSLTRGLAKNVLIPKFAATETVILHRCNTRTEKTKLLLLYWCLFVEFAPLDLCYLHTYMYHEFKCDYTLYV